MRRQDIVVVRNFTAQPGKIGQNVWDVPAGAPIRVPCNVYPLTAEDVTELGLQQLEVKKLFCDSWPGTVHSSIAYDGGVWDQHGPVKTFNKTSVVNVVVTIQRRA